VSNCIPSCSVIASQFLLGMSIGFMHKVELFCQLAMGEAVVGSMTSRLCASLSCDCCRESMLSVLFTEFTSAFPFDS